MDALANTAKSAWTKAPDAAFDAPNAVGSQQLASCKTILGLADASLSARTNDLLLRLFCGPSPLVTVRMTEDKHPVFSILSHDCPLEAIASLARKFMAIGMPDHAVQLLAAAGTSPMIEPPEHAALLALCAHESDGKLDVVTAQRFAGYVTAYLKYGDLLPSHEEELMGWLERNNAPASSAEATGISAEVCTLLAKHVMAAQCERCKTPLGQPIASVILQEVLAVATAHGDEEIANDAKIALDSLASWTTTTTSTTSPAAADQIFTSTKRDSYLKSNQIRWNEFSKETVSRLAEKLARKSNFSAGDVREIFKQLGGARQAIAQEIGHFSQDKEKQLRFGKLRSEIPLGALGRSCWEWYEDKKDDHLGTLESLKAYPFDTLQESAPPPDATEDPEFLDLEALPPTLGYPSVGCSTPDSWEKKVGRESFRIQVIDGGNVHICYPEINEASEARFFEDMAAYLNVVSAMRPEDSREAYLKIFGEISYEAYRFLPFSLGTSAIVNWYIRAIAIAKAVALGAEVGKESMLALDTKAHATPVKEDYVGWFVKSAYRL